MITARQKDKATESVTELVGAFKKPAMATPAQQPIEGDGAFVSPLPPMSLPAPGERRSSDPYASYRTPKVSGVSELGLNRSKRTSGFLSLLGYSKLAILSLHAPSFKWLSKCKVTVSSYN